jgi:hypothetical protein
MHNVPISCIYLLDCMQVFLSELWEYLCIMSFHVLSLLPDLDRTLESFTLCLVLLNLGLTMGIG